MTPKNREAGQGNPFRKTGRGISLLLMLLLVTSPAFAAGGKDDLSLSQILLYVGLIIGVILAAWLLNMLLTRKSDTPHTHPPAKHHHHHHGHHKHHPHPRR